MRIDRNWPSEKKGRTTRWCVLDWLVFPPFSLSSRVLAYVFNPRSSRVDFGLLTALWCHSTVFHFQLSAFFSAYWQTRLSLDDVVTYKPCWSIRSGIIKWGAIPLQLQSTHLFCCLQIIFLYRLFSSLIRLFYFVFFLQRKCISHLILWTSWWMLFCLFVSIDRRAELISFLSFTAVCGAKKNAGVTRLFSSFFCGIYNLPKVHTMCRLPRNASRVQVKRPLSFIKYLRWNSRLTIWR